MKQTGNRTMLIAALMAGALGGAASTRLWPGPASAFAAQQAQQLLTSISAKQFEVMDDQGNMRAKLNVSGEGMAHLGLYDQQGVERAALVVTREGSSMLALSGDDGKPRLAASVAIHDGPAEFALLNPDSTTAAGLTVNKNRRSLMLANDKGDARMRLQSDLGPNGESALTIYDSNGKPLKKFP
jgi:hypothetical protein